jgi:predicted ribosome quality control (RQC) complex YloA/Tae2 family protein
MSMDGFVITALHRELEKQVLPARVNKVYQPSAHEILLHLRRSGESLKLLLSTHPRLARVHLTRAEQENPPSPPRFCLFLRKYLEGRQLVAIQRPRFERILEFYFHARTELGEPEQRILTLEIMGKNSNIVLRQGETGKIYDSLRHVTPAMSRYRQILPGQLYIPPPAQGKKDPRQVQELTFYSSLQKTTQPLPQALIQVFAGLSPLLAQELVYRAGLAPAALPGELNRQQLGSLWDAFSQLVAVIEEHKERPTVVMDHRGNPLAFSLIPLQHFTTAEQLSFASINAAADFYYHHREKQEAVARLKEKLQGLLGKEIKRLEKTIDRQVATLQAMEKGEEYRRFGELLTANLYQVTPGDRAIIVTDYYSPSGEKIQIPLDPSLSPAANAQKYFQKYRKTITGRPHLEKQLAHNQSELTYLESTALALADAATWEEVTEIRRELAAQGYDRGETRDRQRASGHRPADTRPRPLAFRSRDGFTILVGKNNRQNDYLTRRLASKEDYWFHAKDIPGSHVIIRCPPQTDPPASTLEDAALLAAYYSKGRSSNQVAVDYTRVKNVRKPRGARPGMVIYEEYKTIFITPSREEVAKLLPLNAGDFPGNNQGPVQ